MDEWADGMQGKLGFSLMEEVEEVNQERDLGKRIQSLVITLNENKREKELFTHEIREELRPVAESGGCSPPSSSAHDLVDYLASYVDIELLKCDAGMADYSYCKDRGERHARLAIINRGELCSSPTRTHTRFVLPTVSYAPPAVPPYPSNFYDQRQYRQNSKPPVPPAFHPEQSVVSPMSEHILPNLPANIGRTFDDEASSYNTTHTHLTPIAAHLLRSTNTSRATSPVPKSYSARTPSRRLCPQTATARAPPPTRRATPSRCRRRRRTTRRLLLPSTTVAIQGRTARRHPTLPVLHRSTHMQSRISTSRRSTSPKDEVAQLA
ncbi:hypothetical protein M422DRAFT_257428 [Sphaerobolus stellatus SS14]|uniref:Uncharacterized protein n=1 Tax=Sphaerobolus stellatus (strain SS14) TaxID=990650 RepID=A0A0C9VPP5_SPHS4|nr:hypothetical protein M422DRAFT_257428 [Sphaerobolus stellatus SS14]